MIICENCRFWSGPQRAMFSFTSEIDEFGQPKENIIGYRGLCLRHAPVYEKNLGNSWPMAMDYDRCGDAEPPEVTG